MRRLQRQDEPPSPLERSLGALMAFVFGGLTVFAIPWLLAWKFPVRFGALLGLPGLIFVPLFYAWMLFVALATLRIGYKVGVYDMMDVFNVMWRTGESHELRILDMAQSIRNTMIVSAIATYLLLVIR